MGKKPLFLGFFSAVAGVSGADPSQFLGRSAECFEYGYDYNGYDVHQVPFVSSPMGCQEECATYRGCAFWTYDTSSRICYLKSAGAFTERVPSRLMISGPKQCSFTQNCYDVGIDYYGYDIEKIEGRYVMSPMDCQRLCTGNPQCAFFSWRFSTHACYLKSSSSVLGRRDDPDVTSGPRYCNTGGPNPPTAQDFPSEFDPSQAPAPCVESGVEYRGYNIKTTKARSAAACQRDCQQLRDCHYWTWSASNNVCLLKHADAPQNRIQTAGTLDKVSGSRDCIPVMPGCQYANVGIVGARLTSRQAGSFDVCQLFCSLLSGCTHFSHDLYTGECSLWSSFNAYSQGRTTQGVVSGPAFCSAEEVCFEQGDYVGHNVDEDETGEVASPSACQNLCRNNADCHYWTWFRSNKGCYLKDANALLGRTNELSSLGRFSGPKWCMITHGCVSINAVFTGKTFDNKEEKDYKSCASACKDSPFCTAWTYHTDLSLCSMFQGEASLAQMPVRGTLSGTRDCMKEIVEDESCFDEGIMYDLENIIAVLDVQTPYECYARCNTHSSCQRWSLKNQETCYLLKGTTSFIFDPNSISGPKLCPDYELNSSKSVLFKGGEIGRHHTYTAGSCMRKCALTIGCHFWVFQISSPKENCTLHNETASAVSPVDSVVESGLMPPRSMISRGCAYTDPIGSVTVSKPLECQRECQHHPLCAGWQTTVMTLPKGEGSSQRTKMTPAVGKGSSLLACTLYKTDVPVRVGDPSSTCGSVFPFGMVSLGTKVNGNKLEAKTAQACHFSCLNNADCVAWSLSAEGECSLGSDDHEEVSEPGAMSGKVQKSGSDMLSNVSLRLPAEATEEQPRLSPSSGRLLSPFRRRVAAKTPPPKKEKSVHDCISRCKNDTTCTAWTYKDEYCTLFSTAAIPVADNGAISGTRSTQPPSEWIISLNVKFSGEPHSEKLVEEGTRRGNFMDCTDMGVESWCWSYTKVEKGAICYLYKECTQTEEATGFISGTSIHHKPSTSPDQP